MWVSLLKLLPWESLFGLIVKLILHFIDRSEEKKEAKEYFLKFINEIEKDMSVNLNKKYRKQLNELKEHIRLEKIQEELLKERLENESISRPYIN